MPVCVPKMVVALFGTTARQSEATTNYTALSTAMTNGAVIFAPFKRDLNTNANSGTAWWQQGEMSWYLNGKL